MFKKSSKKVLKSFVAVLMVIALLSTNIFMVSATDINSTKAKSSFGIEEIDPSMAIPLNLSSISSNGKSTITKTIEIKNESSEQSKSISTQAVQPTPSFVTYTLSCVIIGI